MSKHPTCGRCDVYRHLHPTPDCEKPRRSFWWDRHSLWRHVAGALWLALLSDKRRMDIVSRLHERRPHLCWCEFVLAALLDGKKDDYRKPDGCGCYVPLPIGVEEPHPGLCYCTPPQELTP